MPVIRCSWGNCNSDVRTKDSRDKTITIYRYSENGFFKKNTIASCSLPAKGELDFYQIPRPKRCSKSNKIIPDHHSTIVCNNWIKACNRPHSGDGCLNIEKIKYHHFICSKHFKEGKPTTDYPNPESADPYSSPSSRKRKAPKRRYTEETLEDNLCDNNTYEENVILAANALLQLNTSSIECQNDTNSNIAGTPVKVKLQRHVHKKQKDIVSIQKEKVSCPGCDLTFELKDKDINRTQRHRFTQEILRSDETCFRYTGVPNLPLLKQIFKWIEPTAEKIKL